MPLIEQFSDNSGSEPVLSGIAEDSLFVFLAHISLVHKFLEQIGVSAVHACSVHGVASDVNRGVVRDVYQGFKTDILCSLHM